MWLRTGGYCRTQLADDTSAPFDPFGKHDHCQDTMQEYKPTRQLRQDKSSLTLVQSGWLPVRQNLASAERGDVMEAQNKTQWLR